ncbi:MAG TPA: T9SS type A sorting domain-containing protein [Chitinophagaceae bacterium]|nr:T9SS type A sorting domain-containing protein [Chitinophagaceae bacterium]
MKKFLFILIASIGISFYLSAQTTGDYRSVGNGNWNDATKWEIFDGSGWINASSYPGQNSGTGAVTIMNETGITITATVPNPVASLYVSADYACSCDPFGYVPIGKLTFSAESATSLTVTTWVYIFGELRINDQNGAKTHSMFIGGTLFVGDAWSDYDYYQTPTIFQTINLDDKLNVTFNTTVPNSGISGNEFSFQDVTFNGIGISLQTSVIVNGHANFINGIIKDGGLITFRDGATFSGASPASFVEAWVSKEGNDAFTFPIGRNGIYAPLTISAPVGQTEAFIASYHRSDAEGLCIISDPGVLSVSNCEYWRLQAGSSNSNSNSLDVTVGWTTASGCGSSPYINNVSDVTLASSDPTDANASWNSHGGSGVGTTTNGSVTRTGVNMFGFFTLGNLGSCAAPFELKTTNITPNSATVNWSALTSSVSYGVEYSVAGSGTWINAASSTTSKSVNLTGLSPATVYYWSVRSNCTSGSSTNRVSQFFTPIACGDPTGLSTANISSGGATLTWNAVPNALNYDVEYRQSSLNTWIRAVTGTTSVSYNLSGLSELTSYDWHIRANCSAGAGNYIQASFTSLRDCNNIYEPNNASKQAKEIYLGNAIYAGISTVSDVDWFKVTVPNHYNNAMLFSLLNLPMDYDLYVYSNTLKLLGSSTLTGTSNEFVVYNSTSRRATYYIKVVGKNGAYNTSQCYSLGAQLSSTAGSASSKSSPENEVTENSNKQFLYPNPASEFVYLNFNSATEGLVNIQIVNSIGQLVKQHPVNTIKGHNQIKIQVADIRPGMYIIRINKGDLTLTRKFVIAR